MIVGELAFLARWVREMKQKQDSGNRDYYAGYMSAMSTVEGMIAMMPQYDLDKVKDLQSRGGLFSPRAVESILNENPPKEMRFKDGHCKWFTPTEVRELLEKDLDVRI